YKYMNNNIITIAREFGSGGRELGRKLAERLGYDFIDKEVIYEIMKETEFSEEYVRKTLRGAQKVPYLGDMLFYQPRLEVLNAQRDTVLKLAERGGCVIVGRCADFILKDAGRDPYRIFVYADMDYRMSRCRRKNKLDPQLTDKDMKKVIQKIDKMRADYFEQFSFMKWGSRENYELSINTTGQSIDEMADRLAAFLK
ncbi:MAG: cytidylate kinase-like family protein, partial [Parasporobacterium sp.]|nr:cytidylate kinase-like family protein [Parasporobacterium sp.]